MKVLFAVCGLLAIFTFWLSLLTIWIASIEARMGGLEWMPSGTGAGVPQAVTVTVCRCGAHVAKAEEAERE